MRPGRYNGLFDISRRPDDSLSAGIVFGDKRHMNQYKKQYDATNRKTVYTDPAGKLLTYECLDIHRVPTTPGVDPKNQWTVTVDEENEIFRKAEANGWKESGTYWSIGNCPRGTHEIGGDGQTIAKFPKRPQGSPNWHGFPTKRIKGKPSAKFIRWWYDNKVIEKNFKKRLMIGDID